MNFVSFTKNGLKPYLTFLSGLSLALSSILLPAVSASATTQITIPVVDQNNAALPGVLVKACELVQGQQACNQAISDSSGNAVISVSPSSTSSSLNIEAGGPTTSYSRYNGGISFTNGVANASPTIQMQPTTWLDASVTVRNTSNSNAVVPNEQVTLTTTYQGNPRTESANTGSNGIATFKLDAIYWSGSIDASNSNNYFPTVTATLVNGAAVLNVSQYDYTLSGTVSFNSNPVANKAMSVSFNRGNVYSCLNFTTDSSGNYSVAHIGTRYPSINLNPCNQYSDPEFDWVSGFTFNDSSVNQTMNIVLAKTGVTLTVTDAQTSNPVQNLRVKLTSISQNSQGPFMATTDQNGVAKFVGLTPGATYRASYVREQYDNSLRRYEEKVNTSSVTVGNTNSMASETLVLTRLSTAPETPVVITGRVVTGTNNTAISGATVRAYWSGQSGNSYQSYEQTVLTDAQGNYSFSDFPYGNISVNISANGYRQTNSYFAASQSAGTTYNRGSINLRPTPLGNLTYSGVLKDSNQNAISGMRLWLYAAGSSGQPTSVTTDNSGTFSFTGLTQGMYFLSADVWSSDSIYQPFSGQSSSVDLTSSQTNVQLSLSSRTVGNASVSGRVAEYLDVNGESSATPMSGKTVYVWPKNGGQGYSAVTDANGEWSIAGLSNGQEYYVSVQYNYQSYEYPMQNNLVVARNSGGSAHQLLLKQISVGTGSLSGRVKNASDYSNLSGIQVQLYRSLGGATISPVTTNSRGEYSFSNLPAGEYFMVIGDQNHSYKDAYMSVEIGSGSNRINALLTEILTYSGSISGRVLDDRGIPLAGASVEVWNSNDSSLGGYAQTNNQGNYEVSGLPTGIPLNFRVTPAWDLRYEVSSYLTTTTLTQSTPTGTINVQLEAAAFITGTVSGIPAVGNVPPVAVELIDSNSGTVMSVTSVRSDNGVYTFASVPAGDYIIRYTQRANYQGYSGGGWGFASGGTDPEIVSLKPVYWDGTTNGTSDRLQAGVISVAAGGRVAGKSVTVSPGSSIAGTVYVETPDGTSRLTGTRSVLVYIYQKQADGTWEQVGYPEAANGYTNSEIKISGLGAGRYKLKFEDSRRGNNSLSTVYNGGARSLALAPEIVVSSSGVTEVSQTLSIAPPERSAEAIDLDDLGQQLPELENQITVVDELAVGSESSIYVGIEFAGEYVSAFANSTPTTLGDWKQVDSNGFISIVVPADLESGSHRVAVQDANLKVIGWTAVTIAKSESEAGVLAYSPRKVAAAQVDTASSSETTTTNSKKQATSEIESPVEAQSGSIAETNNIWLLYVLSAALLLGIAGAVWLIRSRKS